MNKNVAEDTFNVSNNCLLDLNYQIVKRRAMNNLVIGMNSFRKTNQVSLHMVSFYL